MATLDWKEREPHAFHINNGRRTTIKIAQTTMGLVNFCLAIMKTHWILVFLTDIARLEVILNYMSE